MPMYGICLYMMAGTVATACFGVSLRKACLGYHTLGCVVGSLTFYAHYQLLGAVNNRVQVFFPRSNSARKSL